MSFSGDLSGIGLADVFQNIAGNVTSGTLHVRWRRGERYVLFREGRVAAVAARARQRVPLVQHLRDRGVVDPEALDAFLHKHRRSRKSPAKLMVDQKLLVVDDVRAALRSLVEDEVYDLMRLKEATFTFQDGEPPPDLFDPDLLRAGIALESGPLLIEGARRRDEWDRIARLVSTDRDRFVTLEGWDQVELSPTAADIASLLDGNLDIGDLVQAVAGSRFDVLRELVGLVQQGLVRRCSSDELQDFAQQAVADGDGAGAIGLLQSALQESHRDLDLRLQLAALLEAKDRLPEAAAEHALIGYQRMQDGEPVEALSHYEQAVALDPGDVALQERRLDLLVESGEPEEAKVAVLQLSDLLAEMGLLDRARAILDTVLDAAGLGRDLELRIRRAEVCRGLGMPDEARGDFLLAADTVRKADPAQALTWMREALLVCPDDDELAARIHDIETGAAKARGQRRRRVVLASVGAVVTLCLGVLGVMEIRVAHRVLGAVEQGLAQQSLSEQGAAPEASLRQRLRALAELETNAVEFGWLPSGQRAVELAAHLHRSLREDAESLAAAGHEDAALDLLRELVSLIRRPDLRAQCRERMEAIQLRTLERGVDEALGSIEALALDHSPVEAGARKAIEALVGLGDPRLVPVFLDRLAAAQHPLARVALLEVLSQLNSPDSYGPIARYYLQGGWDGVHRAAMEQLLEQAAEQRGAGHEARWRGVYPDLEAAARGDDPDQRGRAQQLLKLLRGDVIPSRGR